MKPRYYQKRAKEQIHRSWANGHRAVLCVAPTGAGKTFLAVNALKRERVLWVAHRRELVFQAAKTLEKKDWPS